jgi:hypothetical protein
MVGYERVMTSMILLYLRKSGVTINRIERQFKNSSRDKPMKKNIRLRHNTMIVVQKIRLMVTE